MDGRIGQVIGKKAFKRSGVWRLWAPPTPPEPNRPFMYTVSRSYTKIDVLKTSSGVKA